MRIEAHGDFKVKHFSLKWMVATTGTVIPYSLNIFYKYFSVSTHV